ncbi:MAG: hypothetical protein ACTSRR_13040 [Candidatus Heimdallarchaeaceae archaeon]
MRKKEKGKGKKTSIHLYLVASDKKEEGKFTYNSVLKQFIKDRIIFSPGSTFTFRFSDIVRDFLLSLKSILHITFLERIFFILHSAHGGQKK